MEKFSAGENLHGICSVGENSMKGVGCFWKKLTKEDFWYDSKNDQKFNKKRFFFF